MKKLHIVATVALAVLVIGVTEARNDKLRLSIKDAMSSSDAKSLLAGDIKFYFGKEKHSKPSSVLGTFTANKKTNFANKSDKEGCERAFASAMVALQERARREGGNAVINIHSYYNKVEFSSETEYECAAGNIVGSVVLRGTVAKL